MVYNVYELKHSLFIQMVSQMVSQMLLLASRPFGCFFFIYTSAALDIFQRIYWDDPFIVSMPFNFQVNTQENINIIKQLDEAEYDMENCAD